MKISAHIVGVGGIGTVLAWSLARAGWEVTLVERNPAKLAAGQAQGLEVAGQARVKLPFIGFDEWQPPTSAAILLCTKTYDNSVVLARLKSARRLVPVQNGYDIRLEGRDFAGEGIASFIAECERERPVTRITRPGSLHLGARRPASAAEQGELRELAGALRQGHLFDVKLVADVRPFKAAKLMYSAAMAPLAAAAGLDNAELLTDPLAKRLLFGLLLENHAILHQARIALAKIGPFHPDTVAWILRSPGLSSLLAIFFLPSLRNTYCSMVPDIGHGETEIEAYNGHLVRLAGDFPCPLNRAAVRMIKYVMEEGLAPQRRHLENMAADLARLGGSPEMNSVTAADAPDRLNER